MKRTLGTLAAGLLIALCTVVTFANRTMAAADQTEFDGVLSELDTLVGSATGGFDGANLKSEKFFLKRFAKAKEAIAKAQVEAGKGNKRGVGTAIKAAGTILKGIKRRLTDHNADREGPDDVRQPLVTSLTMLQDDVKALKRK